MRCAYPLGKIPVSIVGFVIRFVIGQRNPKRLNEPLMFPRRTTKGRSASGSGPGSSFSSSSSFAHTSGNRMLYVYSRIDRTLELLVEDQDQRGTQNLDDFEEGRRGGGS